MKGAIFDLDGTLLDSMWIWEKADKEVLERHGYQIDREYLEQISRLNNRQCLEYVVSRYHLPMSVEALGEEINGQAFRHYAKDVGLKPGVLAYLEMLKGQGIKLAIATSCLRPMCEAALKNNKIFYYFDAFVYSDELGKNKSQPDIYLEAARQLGEAPENCVVFEDLPIAAHSAKKAGMKVIGVYDAFSRDKEEEMREICHEYIKNFWQIYTKK